MMSPPRGRDTYPQMPDIASTSRFRGAVGGAMVKEQTCRAGGGAPHVEGNDGLEESKARRKNGRKHPETRRTRWWREGVWAGRWSKKTEMKGEDQKPDIEKTPTHEDEFSVTHRRVPARAPDPGKNDPKPGVRNAGECGSCGSLHRIPSAPAPAPAHVTTHCISTAQYLSVPEIIDGT